MPKKLVRVSVVVEVAETAHDPSAEVCRIVGDHIPDVEGITVKSCIGGLMCTADTFKAWESHQTFGTPLDSDTVACVVAGGLAEEADFELRGTGFFHTPSWPE
jgi:hypothetical protein